MKEKTVGGEDPLRRQILDLSEKLGGHQEELRALSLRQVELGRKDAADESRRQEVLGFFHDALKGDMGAGLATILLRAHSNMRDISRQLRDVEKADNPDLYYLGESTSLILGINPPILDFNAGRHVRIGFTAFKAYGYPLLYTNISVDGDVRERMRVVARSEPLKDVITHIAGYPDLTRDKLSTALGSSLSELDAEIEQRMSKFRKLRGVG